MRRILVLALALAAFGGVARTEPLNDGYGYHANFGVFYSSLGRHGEWIQFNAGYAWRPYYVSHGWRPYMYGRWVWSDYGWYWASDEPFGWAVYHYGRWYYDDYYGWIWVPGDVWGPAWVEWRYDDDYIGWAPLSPYATFDVSVGVSYYGGWSAPYTYWNFVPCRNFVGVRVADYVQPIDRTRRIFGNTRSVVNIGIDNNRVINRGVDVSFVERRGNVRVDRADVVASDRGAGERFVRDGDRQRVEVFRPRLDNQVRSEFARPDNAIRAEHPFAFERQADRPADRSPDKGINRQGDRRNDGGFTRPDRAPDPRRDTRIQQRGAAPERRIESPVPPERQMREAPRREMNRPQREVQQQQPRFDRRAPAVRQAPPERMMPRHEAPRERSRDKRDEPPRDRRR